MREDWPILLLILVLVVGLPVAKCGARDEVGHDVKAGAVVVGDRAYTCAPLRGAK